MEYSDEEIWSDGELIDDILGPEGLFADEADEDDVQNSNTQAKENPDESGKEGKDFKEKDEKKVKQPRVVKNSRVTLNFDTLNGKNGLTALKKMFENFKFKGNGHEKEDLAKIISTLQHWMCYQLCPSYDFESCMLQLEALGKKKLVQTLMKKHRLGMDDWGENQSDGVDYVDDNKNKKENTSKNEFDLLLQEEVANVQSEDELCQIIQIPNENQKSLREEAEIILTPEQLERIARNRKLAEERRLKSLSANLEPEVNLTDKINNQSISSSGRFNLDENS